MPDIDIESYLLQSDAKVVVEGVLRKKSRDLKLWKSRQYEVRSDGILVTIHPHKRTPTDVFNVSYAIIKSGPIENVDNSGSSDFSTSSGVSLILDAVNCNNLDIVFDSNEDAENFCFAISSVSIAIDIYDLALQMNWTKILGKVKQKPQLDVLAILRRNISGEAKLLQSAKFFKQSSLRKKETWKTRDYELRSDGILTYKNRIGYKDKNDIIGSFLTRVEVDVGISTTNDKASSVQDAGVSVVNAVEIMMPNEGNRRLIIAFDPENKGNNQKLIDDFVELLRQNCGAIVVNHHHRRLSACPSAKYKCDGSSSSMTAGETTNLSDDEEEVEVPLVPSHTDDKNKEADLSVKSYAKQSAVPPLPLLAAIAGFAIAIVIAMMW